MGRYARGAEDLTLFWLEIQAIQRRNRSLKHSRAIALYAETGKGSLRQSVGTLRNLYPRAKSIGEKLVKDLVAAREYATEDEARAALIARYALRVERFSQPLVRDSGCVRSCVMARTWFDPPVSVEMDSAGRSFVVNSVERAAEILLQWPERGPEWYKAIEACAAALKGKGPPEEARTAFLDAAKAADRLIARLGMERLDAAR